MQQVILDPEGQIEHRCRSDVEKFGGRLLMLWTSPDGSQVRPISIDNRLCRSRMEARSLGTVGLGMKGASRLG